MIRMSEVVLPGHPDKFCDQVADAIVAECYKVDPRAYCQVEVSVWCDQVFLTGSIVTRAPLALDLADIVRATGRRIGYVAPNAIDADRYQVRDIVCQRREDPRTWTDHVNDQCIVMGWAGYDAKVSWLPPEHYLAHSIGRALARSCGSGRLKGQGPDGKLLVRVRESTDDWTVEQLLVTLQQLPDTPLLELTAHIVDDLRDAYAELRARDRRWSVAFDDIELIINPNGPLLNGGSDGDNGQTGRKLVMDYYGPRVPIGGGALSGKDLSHIDRAGAHAARHAALRAVQTGADTCRVMVAYAPNRDVPLDVIYEMNERAERRPREWFAHSAVRDRYRGGAFVAGLGARGPFSDLALPWNDPTCLRVEAFDTTGADAPRRSRGARDRATGAAAGACRRRTPS
jgi:S-adenosylmethionine synthetase